MGLLQKVNEQPKSGLKVLTYGATGTGKTRFALTVPGIAAADSEDGMTWYTKDKELGKNLLFRNVTNSSKDMEELLEEIEEEFEEASIKTFLIDSETKFYQNLQHVQLNIAEARAKKNARSADAEGLSQKEWGKIKQVSQRIQNAKIMLASQGVNIVSVAQESDIKEKQGENFVVVGHKPDVAKSLEFDYDIILRLFTKEEYEKGVKVTRYKAEIIKDRTGTFQKNEVVDNPHFSMWETAYKLGQSGTTAKHDLKKFEEIDEEIFNDQEAIDKAVAEIKKLAKTSTAAMAKLTEFVKSGRVPEKFAFESVKDAKSVLAELTAL